MSQTIFSKTKKLNKKNNPSFEIFSKKNQALIFYDKNGAKLDSITSYLLAEDIYKVTHYKPKVVTNINEAVGNVIIIGNVHSKWIQDFLTSKSLKEGFEKQSESYCYKTLSNPNKKISKAFIIAGTDPRGTAFGVFDLSQKIGVSPWNWWADVPVKQSNELIIQQTDYYSKNPSVKFRGIFLNDEDWGLRPWAAKTFEPELGNIGPKTYAKIFELLLRLKANSIWPAMHEGTTAFFKIPQNIKVAEAYQIVIGSSHAEPMLRNNVDEWKEKEMGHFNYVSNKENVYKYWEDRVKEAKNVDAIYTIGMRGVHDSKMEGVKTNKEGAELLKQIIKDQRKLFETHLNPDATKVPQAFTVYKEVLDLYEEGLQVPEDVTLVWTDDNYGYIRRLSNPEEQKRKGGGGVYYHASYWGRPHDYLWLDSVHPALIREEMMKAYQANCKEIWILNVGDLKSIEYSTQLFLDMAYNAPFFEDPSNTQKHTTNFFTSIFGKEYGQLIADSKWKYFDLAFERKPEFMGWSQTEPNTKTKQTAYNPFFFGDENQTRVAKYQSLENEVVSIKDKLPKEFQDAYFQLVYYPAKAASLINKKFLFADKATIYAKQQRLSAKDFASKAANAFDEIKTITKEYNQIANGKWKLIMDMNPRKLPVFQMPTIEIAPQTAIVEAAGILVENETNETAQSKLPTYLQGLNTPHFIDLFLKKAESVSWNLQNLPDWVVANKTTGVLNATENNSERIQISIDWNKWNKNQPKSAHFTINCGTQTKVVVLNVDASAANFPKKSFVSIDEKVVVYAQNFSSKKNQGSFEWKKIDGLGYSKAAMQAMPLNAAAIKTDNLAQETPCLEYQIYLENLDAFVDPQLILNAIPTLPMTNKQSVRLGVQWNQDPVQIIDFATVGRSDEWKENVLSNKASKKIVLKSITKGLNTLKIYMIDPAVAVDYFYINLNKNNPIPYSLLPETIK